MQAYKGRVVIHNIERGEARSNFGIYLGNDDGTLAGIKPRWAQVYSVGEDVTELQVGYWILVQHGRWTRGVETEDGILYMVDYPSGVLAYSPAPEKPDIAFVPEAQNIEAFKYRPEDFNDVERTESGIYY